ncbi:hypothetical protein HW555_010371, partial [Spodoptera exigua]
MLSGEDLTYINNISSSDLTSDDSYHTLCGEESDLSAKIKEHQKESQQYCIKIKRHNFIDEEVQSMLLPLNIMQNILGYPKYRIRDNFIIPNSRLVYLVSLCVTLISVALLFYRSLCYLKDKVVLWNIQIKDVQNMDCNEKEYYCQNFFQSYINILECYNVYRICFQQHYVEIISVIGRDFSAYIITVLKKMLLGFLLSLEFEKFYEAMNDIQETCRLMSISSCT